MFCGREKRNINIKKLRVCVRVEALYGAEEGGPVVAPARVDLTAEGSHTKPREDEYFFYL